MLNQLPEMSMLEAVFISSPLLKRGYPYRGLGYESVCDVSPRFWVMFWEFALFMSLLYGDLP